jgi:hypothetical protein
MALSLVGISAVFKFGSDITGAASAMSSLDNTFDTYKLSSSAATSISNKFGISLEGIQHTSILAAGVLRTMGGEAMITSKNMELATSTLSKFSTFGKFLGRSDTQITKEINDVFDMLNSGKVQSATTVLKNMGFNSEQIDNLAKMKGNLEGFTAELDKMVDARIDITKLFDKDPKMAMQLLETRLTNAFGKALENTTRALLPFINKFNEILLSPDIGKYASGIMALVGALTGMFILTKVVALVRATKDEIISLGKGINKVATGIADSNLGEKIANALGGGKSKSADLDVGKGIPDIKGVDKIEKLSTQLKGIAKGAVKNMAQVAASAAVVLTAVAAGLLILYVAMEGINAIGDRSKKMTGLDAAIKSIEKTVYSLLLISPVIIAIGALGTLGLSTLGTVAVGVLVGAGVALVAISSAMVVVWVAMEEFNRIGDRANQMTGLDAAVKALDTVLHGLGDIAIAMGLVAIISWETLFSGIEILISAISGGKLGALPAALGYLTTASQSISDAGSKMVPVSPDVIGKITSTSTGIGAVAESMNSVGKIKTAVEKLQNGGLVEWLLANFGGPLGQAIAGNSVQSIINAGIGFITNTAKAINEAAGKDGSGFTVNEGIVGSITSTCTAIGAVANALGSIETIKTATDKLQQQLTAAGIQTTDPAKGRADQTPGTDGTDAGIKGIIDTAIKYINDVALSLNTAVITPLTGTGVTAETVQPIVDSVNNLNNAFTNVVNAYWGIKDVFASHGIDVSGINVTDTNTFVSISKAVGYINGISTALSTFKVNDLGETLTYSTTNITGSMQNLKNAYDDVNKKYAELPDVDPNKIDTSKIDHLNKYIDAMKTALSRAKHSGFRNIFDRDSINPNVNAYDNRVLLQRLSLDNMRVEHYGNLGLDINATTNVNADNLSSSHINALNDKSVLTWNDIDQLVYALQKKFTMRN